MKNFLFKYFTIINKINNFNKYAKKKTSNIPLINVYIHIKERVIYYININQKQFNIFFRIGFLNHRYVFLLDVKQKNKRFH